MLVILVLEGLALMYTGEACLDILDVGQTSALSCILYCLDHKWTLRC